MADVGVLSIEIESNSDSAAQSLDKLAGALKRVQTAIGDGLNLSGVTAQIESIGRAVNDSLSGSTFAKISDLAKSIKELQKANSTKAKVDKVFDGNQVGSMAADATKQYDAMTEAAQRYASAVTSLSTEYTKAWQAMNSIDFVFPSGLRLGEGNRTLGLGPGGVAPENMLSTQVWMGPNWKPDWTDGSDFQTGFQMMQDFSDDVIETSGIVTDEFDNIVGRVGTAAQSVDEFSGRMETLEGIDMSAINTGFGTVADAVRNSTEALNEFAEKLQEIQALSVNMGWTSGSDMFGQFQSMLNAMVRMKSAMALGSGTQLSTDVETGWTYWKDGAIEVEGTVTGAVESIDSVLTGTNQLLLEAGENMDHISETSDKVSRSFSGVRMFDPQTGDFTKPLEESLNEYRSSLGERMGRMGVAEGLQTKESFDEARSSIDNVREAATSARGPVQNLMNALANGQINPSMQNAASGINQLGDAANSMGDAPERLEETANAGGLASRALDTVRDSIHGLMNAARHSTLGTLISQFTRIARYRALRAILKEITSSIKEGFENYQNYSDQVGNQFSKELKQVNAQFAQMKNSIGAAIAPALKAALPVLQQIISLATAAINVVNQLIALLTGGSSWTAAAPVLGASKGNLEGMSKSSGEFLGNMKDAAEEVNDVQKKSKDLLADWDELNIIQSKSGGGGGGGKTLEDALNAFREMAFDARLKMFVDTLTEQFGSVLNFVKRIGAALLTWKLSTALTGALATISSLLSAGLVLGLVFDISSVFDKMYLRTGEEGWLLGDILTTLVGGVLANKLLTPLLGGTMAKIGLPIALAVSAIASVVALIGEKDVSALSEESIKLSLLSALEMGGAIGGAIKLLSDYSVAEAAGAGVGAALIWFGASIGIKATADVFDTGEITEETIGADLISALSVGGGLSIMEASLGGTAGTIAGAGLGGALITLGTLIAVQYTAKVFDSGEVDNETVLHDVFAALSIGGGLSIIDALVLEGTAGTIAGSGIAGALVTLGALIAVQYTAKVFNTGEISKDTVVADVMSAIMLGAGAFALPLALVAGTVGTVIGGGIAGALFTLGALIAVQTGIVAAESGVTMDTIRNTAFASLAAGVGAGLFAKIMGGSIAAALGIGGFTIAAIAVAVGLTAVLTMDEKLPIKWGTKQLTQEQIEAFVNKDAFTINVPATVKVITDHIDTSKVSRSSINATLTKVLGTFNVIRLGIANKEDYTELDNQINGEGGLISTIQGYIEEAKNTGKLTLQFTPTLVGDNEKEGADWLSSYTSGWDTVDSFAAQKGKEIGDLLIKAETGALTAGEAEVLETLMNQLSNVTSAIASASITSEAFGNLKIELGDLTQASFDDIVTAFANYKDQLRTQYDALVKEQYIKQSELVAALFEIDPNSQKYKDALATLQEMEANLAQAAEDGVNKAAKPGMDMITEFLLDKYQYVIEDLGERVGERISTFNPLERIDFSGATTGDAAASIKEWAYNYVSMMDEDLGNYVSALGLNPFAFLPENVVGKVKQDIIAQFGDQAVDILKLLFPEETIEAPPLDTTNLEESAEQAKGMLDEKLTDVGDVNTTKAQESFENLEASADAHTEGVIEDTNKLSGLSVGGADFGGLIGSFSAMANSIWASVNSALAAYSRLGGMGGIGGGGGIKLGGGGLRLFGGLHLGQQFAKGGFPDSGSLFMADENGNIEMKGKMGSQPVVANNQQIIEGISKGVSEAQSEQTSLLTRQNELLMALINKSVTAEVRPTASLGRAGVRSQRMYDRVTGR